MGLRSMTCTDGDLSWGILYCSTAMRALPYIFRSQRDADDFAEIHGDIRKLDEDERETLFDAWDAEWPEEATDDDRHPRAVRELGADP